jgi:adenylate cyclase
MFLDIRDFSRLANDHSPSEVMSYLNILFGFMIPVINEHHGIINKFLGDGFMAVFGAPIKDDKQCHHAVDAAMKILGHVEQLKVEGRIPPTRLGIGLHIGRVITGNVGGTERKEYTIIGDAVNLASRIEQATKQLGGQLLVSQAVAAMIAGAKYTAQDMGLIELKGQAQPVRLFKLA